jgi:hypothetical protein
MFQVRECGGDLSLLELRRRFAPAVWSYLFTKLPAAVDTRPPAVLRFPLASTSDLQFTDIFHPIQVRIPKAYDRSTAVLLAAAQHKFGVNLLNRVRTACHRWLASASKPFWTASEKHTIAVDTMSQVRKCGRALSIAGAGEEIRPRMLE